MRMRRGLFGVVLALILVSVAALAACGKEPEDNPPAKTLASIAVTGDYKTAYVEDDTFDKTGMVVTAKYSDESSAAVTDYTVAPSGALKTTDTSVTVGYTEGGVTKNASVTISVSAKSQQGEPEVLSVAVTTTGGNTVVKGATKQFSADVTVQNGAAKTVTWGIEGNNDAGTTISDAGLLTVAAAESAANLTVTATSTVNTAKSGTLGITVTAPDPGTVLVSEIIIWTPGPIEMVAGEVLDDIDFEVLPGDADNKTVTWSSGTPAAATVQSATGVITAVAAGSTVITATANDGGGVTATITVNVVIKAASVTLNRDTLSFTLNPISPQVNSFQLNATVLPAGTTNKNVRWSIELESDPAGVVSLENGLVTGLRAGTATVRATTLDGSNKYDECEITVTAVAASSIAFDGGHDTLYLALDNEDSKSGVISAVVSPANAADKTLGYKILEGGTTTVSVVQNNFDFTITATGGAGTVTVQVFLVGNDTIYKNCVVLVADATVYATGIEIDEGETASVTAGLTLQLTATVTPPDATNPHIVWSTSDDTVADVDAETGLVTAVAAGTATITVTVTGESGATFTDIILITVSDKEIASVAVTTPPTKSDYVAGQDFNAAGLIITVTYNNGTSDTFAYDSYASNFSFASAAALTLGTDKVVGTFALSGYGSADFDVDIRVEEKAIASIAVTNNPAKMTDYIEGQDADLDGLEITATYNDGTTATLAADDYTVSGDKGLAIGDNTVTIKLNADNSVATVLLLEGVRAKQVSSLAVKTAPTKKNYIAGDSFDPAGLVISIVYDNGDTADITYAGNAGDFSFAVDGNPIGGMAAGTTIVVVSYGGMTADITELTVGTLSHLTFSGDFITSYLKGELFNPNGLTVTAHYTNGLSGTVTGYTLTPSASTALTTADNKITVSFTLEGVTKTVDITILVREVTAIAISRQPVLLDYEVGNPFIATGLEIEITYNNGDKAKLAYSAGSGITFDVTAFAAEGAQTVTVTYKEKTATVNVTVTTAGQEAARWADFAAWLSDNNNRNGTYTFSGNMDAGATAASPFVAVISNFTGTIDGAGYTLKNLTTKKGLFNGLSDNGNTAGTVKNLNIINGKGVAEAAREGSILAGTLNGNASSKFTIDGVFIQSVSETAAWANVGGLIAQINNAATLDIKNSRFDITVNGTGGVNSGGLFGQLDQAKVNFVNCVINVLYNKTANNSGGIAGQISNAGASMLLSFDGVTANIIMQGVGALSGGIMPGGDIHAPNFKIAINNSKFGVVFNNATGDNLGGAIGRFGSMTFDIVDSVYNTNFTANSETAGNNKGGIIGYGKDAGALKLTIARSEVKTEFHKQTGNCYGGIIGNSANYGDQVLTVEDSYVSAVWAGSSNGADKGAIIGYADSASGAGTAKTIVRNSRIHVAVPSVSIASGIGGIFGRCTIGGSKAVQVAVENSFISVDASQANERGGLFGRGEIIAGVTNITRTLANVAVVTSGGLETLSDISLAKADVIMTQVKSEIATVAAAIIANDPAVWTNKDTLTFRGPLSSATLAVKELPTKSDYVEGENFDSAGLVVTMTFANGDTEDFTTGFIFTNGNALIAGADSVTGKFGNFSFTVPVTVSAKAIATVAVSVDNGYESAHQTTYALNEAFKPAGLIVKVTYDNWTPEYFAYNDNSALFTSLPDIVGLTGEQTVQGAFKNVSFEITVTIESKEIEAIAITASPKIDYTENDFFDPTGMEITVEYSDGSFSAPIPYADGSGIDYSPKGRLKQTDTEVTVTYEGKEAKLTIIVAKDTSALPEPSNPIYINSWEEFVENMTVANKDRNFYMNSDITATSAWTSLMMGDNGFTGIFEGNNKTIHGLEIASVNNNGLFGSLRSKSANNDKSASVPAEIRNLTLQSPVMTGNAAPRGFLIGEISKGQVYGKITNVNIIDASINVSGANIGGIVGNLNDRPLLEIIDCSFTSKVTESDAYGLKSTQPRFGAIAGQIQNYAMLFIKRGTFNVGIESTQPNTGGLVGTISGGGTIVAVCDANVRISIKSSSQENFGGLIGNATDMNKTSNSSYLSLSVFNNIISDLKAGTNSVLSTYGVNGGLHILGCALDIEFVRGGAHDAHGGLVGRTNGVQNGMIGENTGTLYLPSSMISTNEIFGKGMINAITVDATGLGVVEGTRPVL